MQLRQIELDGELHMGAVVDIDQVWAKYAELMLENGVVLRVRFDVSRVVLLSEPGPDGDPRYVVEGTPVVSVKQMERP